MATKGTIKGTVNKTLYLTFEWSRTSVNIDKNTSTISWSLKLYSTSSLVFSADKPYTLKVNGSDYGGTFTTNINWGSGGGNAVIKSGSTVIEHDPDSPKTFNVSAVFNIAVNISGVQVSSLSLSGNQILDTIPRATTPMLTPTSNIKMGDVVKITLNRASANFTHDITYKFGKSSGTIGDDIETSVNWTIPRALANQIPNGLSGVCVITCKTYNGTTLIGTITVNVTISVNDGDYPTITSVNISEAISGLDAKFGAYIQNHSKLNIDIQASGVYGSVIKKYETKILNTTYDKATFISGLLSVGGEIDIVVKVTDSRNRTKSLTKKINVLDYSPPKIELFSCARATSSGVENDEETYLKSSIRFKITSLGDLNDKTYKLQYREQGTETWLLETSGSVYTFNGIYVSKSGILDADKPYEVRLVVSDYFSEIPYSIDIGTGFTLGDVHESGRGLALGKVAEIADLFDVNLDTLFRKNLHIEGKLTYDIPTIKNGSINDVLNSGVYYLANEIADRPIALNGWLEVRSYLDTYIYQRYVTYTGRTFERLMSNGTWGDWCGVFTSGIWTYEKRLDGTLHMWGEFEASNIDFNVKVADSWYRPSTNFRLEYPITFINQPIVFFGTGLGGTAGSVLCYTISSNTTASSFWTQKMITGVANLKIPIEVIGKWK